MAAVDQIPDANGGARIAGHTHDLELGRRLPLETEVSPNGIVVAEQHPRHGLAQHGHPWRVGRVALVDAATVQDGDLQRVEEARRGQGLPATTGRAPALSATTGALVACIGNPAIRVTASPGMTSTPRGSSSNSGAAAPAS